MNPCVSIDKMEQPAQQASPARGAQAAPLKVTPSKKATPALIELQTAVQKKDVANIPAKLAAAQAVATTKEDRYLIGKFQLEAAIAANDNIAAGAAIEAMASSGVLDAAASSSLYQSLGGTFFNAKDYASSVTAYQKALSVNPNNAEAQSMLIDAYLGAGQKAQAGARCSGSFRPARRRGRSRRRRWSSARWRSPMKPSRPMRPNSRGSGWPPIRARRAGATRWRSTRTSTTPTAKACSTCRGCSTLPIR